jgi:hypothetical protein
MRPELRSLADNSNALSREADVLTGKSPGDKIDGPKLSGVKHSYVSELGNIGPMFRKHSDTIGVIFHLPRAVHSSAFQS